MGYLIFRIKLFYRESKDKLIWKIAYLLPRQVAIVAFVRVYSVLDSPGEDYTNAYKLFESGIGK